MKKLLLVAAAVATVGLTIPASAQVVVREGHRGVAVRVGGGHPHCRTITERTRVGHRVIVKTRRVCR